MGSQHFPSSGLQKGHGVRQQDTKAYRLSEHTRQALQGSHTLGKVRERYGLLSPDQETKPR